MKGKAISKEKLKKLSRFSTRAYDQTPRRRLPDVNWDLVKDMTDDDIDYSDIPATDEEFWADAELIVPENKVALGVRFDRDVVDWFKKQGPGYQTRMNAVLRLYMQRKKKRR
ncbi:MAG: BrnA antitoxin family protein [Candidatus Obscuribacterales bacterium]|nr:BrnA antitoxin family protein [Candidatus Obscuribacterales bacterium]